MCDPVTALAVGSTVLQAYSQFEQGQTAKATARFNAREQENQAVETRNAGTIEENKLRRETSELRERQRSQLAANGVDVNTGTALSLQEDTTTIGEVDALRIRSNVDNRATSLERSAEVTKIQGDNAARAGIIGAGSTLLSGAGKAFSGTGGNVNSKWFGPNSSAVTGGGIGGGGFA